MSSSLSKIIETGINVFKSNSQIQNTKIYQLFTNALKNNRWRTTVCNIWMICLELNWFVYDPSWMLHLSEFVWTLCSSVWVVFNNFLLIDATDRSEIFFIAKAYTPFHFSRTLPLRELNFAYLPSSNHWTIKNNKDSRKYFSLS